MAIRLLVALVAIIALAGCASTQTMDGERTIGSDQRAEAEEVRMDAPETVGILATDRLLEAVLEDSSAVGLFEITMPETLSGQRIANFYGDVRVPRRTWYGSVLARGREYFAQAYLSNPASLSAVLIVDAPQESLSGAKLVLYSTGGEFATNLSGVVANLPASAGELERLASPLPSAMGEREAERFLAGFRAEADRFDVKKRRGVYAFYPKDLGEEALTASLSTNPEYTAWGRVESRGGLTAVPDPVGALIATGLQNGMAALDCNPIKGVMTGNCRSTPFYGARSP